MKPKVVFMFSGQGSQYFHMGRELYLNNARFKLWMDHCDKIIYSTLRRSLLDIIYDDSAIKSDPFDRVLYTMPALLCIEYSLARLLMEMKLKPDYLLGYSIGEFTAAIVSGAMPLEEGLRLGVTYAQLIEEKATNASMLAIVDSADIMQKYPKLFENCWLTGRNFQGNFVVSGGTSELLEIQSELKKMKIISQQLPVNYAFHTKLVEPLKIPFKKMLGKINFSDIKIPTISAQTGEQIFEVNENYLWDVTRYPVEFEGTINKLVAKEDCLFVDVGPSGSLATFVKYLLGANSKSNYLEVINQYGKNLKTFDKVKEKILEINSSYELS